MKKIALIILGICVAASTFAQSVYISDVRPEEAKGVGFNLSRETEIDINGAGATFSEDWQTLVFYAWIIDSDTRKVVWHLFDTMSDRDKKSSGVFDFNNSVTLKAGNYELYYAGMESNDRWNNDSWALDDFNMVIDQIFSSRDYSKYRSSLREDLFVEVKADGLKKVDLASLVNKKIDKAIISFNHVGDDERLSRGFSLKSKTDLRVYALGEGRNQSMFDYFWIMDAENRETVYSMDYQNTDFAGGAKKNLLYDEVISLPAGSYILNYSSDDSHSARRWNSMPPNDIQFWGVTIWPATAKDAANVSPFKAPKTLTPLVDLTRVRDDELVSKGVKLDKDLEVRILCLGEKSSYDEMADYGWIIDAASREKVWEMKQYQSNHAGGADKNRIVNKVISMPKGEYIVYYVTDGSHSYRDWNASKPSEEEMWGISLWATNAADIKSVTSFDPAAFKPANVLSSITMVGDREYAKDDFTLNETTTLRVVGIGEGSDGDMFDFGYIKSLESGRVVWDMDYRNSEHAGGASKNRAFNEKVTLPKGEYRVYFESDGSHSYSHWNSSPPRDQEMWGLTIFKE